MNYIPIVFAFDNNLVMPANICIYSLFVNALPQTHYDVYILYPNTQHLNKDEIIKTGKLFPNHSINFMPVDDNFSDCYQIRNINSLTYYRLLIPELIHKYDKIFYSDVDVIFRTDLSDLYTTSDLTDKYVMGVNSYAHLDKDLNRYYSQIGLNPNSIIYAGNILINSKLMRADNIVGKFIKMTKNKYRFQDMDIINIVCKDKIGFLPLWHCMTSYLYYYILYKREYLLSNYTKKDIQFAQDKGVIHYNGQKPWQGYCVNFDIWWEYYRKSPVYDEKFYFDFFYNKLNELDLLPLLKRIKILIRYFVYGRTKNS